MRIWLLYVECSEGSHQIVLVPIELGIVLGKDVVYVTGKFLRNVRCKIVELVIVTAKGEANAARKNLNVI